MKLSLAVWWSTMVTLLFWNECNTAMLISTRALSFHNVAVVWVSNSMQRATFYVNHMRHRGHERHEYHIKLINWIWIINEVKCITSRIFKRLVSQRFRQPISVDMYHPLNAVAVNSMPPQSNSILDTAGTAYHRKLRSLNQSYLKIWVFEYCTWQNDR